MRVGHGYDLHRLAQDQPGQGGKARVKPLVIGGVRFEQVSGVAGGVVGVVAHSDGDALLHAITDAILGALAEPDIGQLFPDTDPKWAGVESAVFVAEARRRMEAAGWEISNLDATLVLERPKLGPRKEEVRQNIARLLGLDGSRVNLKGKTHEGVDAVGEGRAIEAHAVVLLVRLAHPAVRGHPTQGAVGE